MSDSSTQFPPQSYSSSFFLNKIPDENEKSNDNSDALKDPDLNEQSCLLFDCFSKNFLPSNKRNETTCNTDTLLLQSGEKEAGDLWKLKHSSKSSLRAESPRNAFKRWKKNNAAAKPQLQNHPLTETEENKDGEMSLLKFLALNALDLSVPASDILLKSRSSNWFQLSGHPDSLAPAGPGTVWKKTSIGQDDNERFVYEQLSQDASVKDIIPKYYREVEYQGERFIELQDLLHGFQDPYVIDIKMGTRTFLESEVSKKAARSDLYQKMIAIDRDAPTSEEHEAQGVTKLRYMQFREHQSSTCSHGFRIEAMKCRGSPPVTDLKRIKSSEQVVNTLDMFLNGRDDVKQRITQRLQEMRSKIEQSEFFSRNEVIGSSLFIIYDNNKVGVWLIDFAKTMELPVGLSINHRDEWVQGNHEDGLLFGFDQIINVLGSINTTSRNGGVQQAATTVSVKS